MVNYKSGSLIQQVELSSDQASITTLVDITGLTLTLPNNGKKYICIATITHANTTLGANDIFEFWDNGSQSGADIVEHQDVATYYDSTTLIHLTTGTGQIIKIRAKVAGGSMTIYGASYQTSLKALGI